MAKFNSKTRPAKADTYNVAGAPAYSRDSIKQEIASVVLNTMVNGDSYYQTEKDSLKRIAEMVTDNLDIAEYLMKCAIYCRTVGNLRSISHYMAVILAENVKGHNKSRVAYSKIIERPDDALEIVALWNSRNHEKMLPNSLRRAIKDVLEEKFDFYQLRKYLGKRNAVKLRDLIKLTRPNPNKWWNKFGEDFTKKYK